MDQEPDAALIAASLDTPVAFAAVFDRHFDFVHRYLGRRVGPDIADDLASETFTTAFRVRARFDLVHIDARPWLLGIATNIVRHHRRAEVRRLRAYARIEVAQAAGIDEDAVAARADAAAERPQIAHALARIPTPIETRCSSSSGRTSPTPRSRRRSRSRSAPSALGYTAPAIGSANCLTQAGNHSLQTPSPRSS